MVAGEKIFLNTRSLNYLKRRATRTGGFMRPRVRRIRTQSHVHLGVHTYVRTMHIAFMRAVAMLRY